jgi:S1-C subfamily serine protease
MEPSPAADPPPPPPPLSPHADGGRRGPRWLAVALVASVVGAGVGAGVTAAVDRRNGSGPVTTFSSNTSTVAKPQDVQGILAKVEPGVVSIETSSYVSNGRGVFGGGQVTGAGSGMILTADGEVLTDNHVIEGATSIKVTIFGQTEAHDAVLIGTDAADDVALIKIQGVSGLPTVTLGDSDKALVGDDVVAIGNALALAGGPSVTEGIVSAKDRSLSGGTENLTGLIQTDAAINPGNSGGPLVNSSGEVIGMNTAVIEDAGSNGATAQNIGFAIGINRIKPIVESLRSGKSAPATAAAGTGFLGVSTETTSNGVVVAAVTAGSPAENAGLQEGDVITKIDSTSVTTADQLVAAVQGHKAGDKISLTINRGGASGTVSVTLGARTS